MRTLLPIVLLLCMLPACAEKVGNPENDKDQVDTTDAELLSVPEITGEFKLPTNSAAVESLDPSIRSVAKDILAVGDVAASAPATLNQFFTNLDKLQLKRNEVFEVEFNGVSFTGQTSWEKKEDDSRYATVVLCAEGSPVSWVAWQPDSGLPIKYIRDLRYEVLSEDKPLIKGLKGVLDADVSPVGESLGIRYQGEQRNPETLETVDDDVAVQFYATVSENGTYTTQGNYGPLRSDRTASPTSTTSLYGVFDGKGVGSVLVHLGGLCPDFSPQSYDQPGWCVALDLSEDSAQIFEGEANTKWKELRNDLVPLPDVSQLGDVSFPEEAVCPK